jgi:hypothetical protein
MIPGFFCFFHARFGQYLSGRRVVWFPRRRMIGAATSVDRRPKRRDDAIEDARRCQMNWPAGFGPPVFAVAPAASGPVPPNTILVFWHRCWYLD